MKEDSAEIMVRKKKLLFLAALAASVLLHFLLLLTTSFAWKHGVKPRPAGDPILVSLVRPTQTGVHPEAKDKPVLRSSARRKAPEPAQFPLQSPTEPVKLESAVVESPPLDSPPAAETSPTAPELESEAPQAKAAAGNSLAAPEQAAGEAAAGFGKPVQVASAQAPQAAAFAAENAGYRRLLEALRSRIVAAIRYPALARSRGWKGTVLLVASLDAQGRLQELLVQKSSGHSVLDQAAAALVRRVTLTPIENTLGRPLAIEIPIVYELKER
jgi:protein TonB